MLQQFALLANQTSAMEASWNSTLATFSLAAINFNNIINDARTYRGLVDAIYIGFIDLNISNPMFDGTFYDNVTVETLPVKQSIALQFIQESNNDWISVANMFRARVVFYEAVNAEYSDSLRLDVMFRTVVRSLTTGASEQEVRTYLCRATRTTFTGWFEGTEGGLK